MAASRLVNVTQEVINAIGKKNNSKENKRNHQDWRNPFQKKDKKFLLIELNKPVNS